jgi:hypothetical protein
MTTTGAPATTLREIARPLAGTPSDFDLVLHYDHTRAVKPLERTALWERGEVPETYPSALWRTSRARVSAAASRTPTMNGGHG